MTTFQFFALWSTGQAILCISLNAPMISFCHFIAAYLSFVMVTIDWWNGDK